MKIGPCDVQLVRTPTSEWLASALKGCRERFIACSPFVGNRFQSLVRLAPQQAHKTLVTRLDIRDFALRASSIAAVRELAESGVQVQALANVHAKVYVIDTSAALVSSANATPSGMEANLEFGVAFTEPKVVQAVADEVLAGFGGDAKPETYELAEISALEKLVGRVRARLPRPVDVGRLAEEERAIIELESTEELLEAFGGWRRLTLAGVIAQLADEFQLEDVYNESVPRAAKEYPENRHPQAKLRQQLQSLRDLGLIEFLGRGKYIKNFDARAHEKRG